MPKRVAFSDEQLRVLFATVAKASADKKRFRTQADLAMALKLTQPSLSSLLHRKWKPGLETAEYIAQLESVSLKDLIGPYEGEEKVKPGPSLRPRAISSSGGMVFPNLDVCISFHAGSKHWSAWTIAAAQFGYFGNKDFQPPQWVEKLDALEKLLDRARKAG